MIDSEEIKLMKVDKREIKRKITGVPNIYEIIRKLLNSNDGTVQ